MPFYDNTEWMDTWLRQGWQHNFFKHPESAYLECVLVESRQHPWMPQVLANVSCMFPNAKLTVLYDQCNSRFVDACLENSPMVRRIPLHMQAHGPFDVWKYCELLAREPFWDLFKDSKRVLVFQADTGIRKNRMLRFLEYSYIGAPWGSAPQPIDPWIHLGNGGLSLRDPLVMADVCRRFPYAQQHIAAEDLYFSQRVANMDSAVWPDKDVAAAFSMEHVLHDDPMGFHQIYHWHPQSVLQPLLANCDPSKPTHHIDTIVDAWVEASNGHVVPDPHKDILAWLKTGVGPRGLVIPKDSLVPYCEDTTNNDTSTMGYTKSLAFMWRHQDGHMVTQTVPLKRGRVIEDAIAS
jgi:hypothetical protein